MTWANNDYGYRKKITIDKTKVSGNLTNYPCLISVTDASLKDEGNGGHVKSSSGYDIIFYDSNDSTKLDHELVTYVNTSGLIEAWVRIPSLTNANDYEIYIYYGKAGVAADQSVTTTWSSDFQVVSHLKDLTTSTCKNSSQTAYTLTKKGANEPNQVDGKIGKAQDFDGSNDDLVVNNTLVGTGNKTIELWANPDATGNYQCFFANCFGGSSNDDGIQLIYGASGTTVALNLGNGITTSHFMIVNGTISSGSWQRIVARYDGTTLKLVVNTTTTTSTSKHGSEVAGSYNMMIGNGVNTGIDFNGKICEFRVSNAVKSDDWISTAYNNENSPSTFMSFAAEESNPGGGSALTKSLSSTLTISSPTPGFIWEYGRNFSDTLAISDDFDRDVEYDRELSDTISLSDLDVVSLGFNITPSDSVALADVHSFIYGKGLTEILTISDDLDALKYFLRTISDVLAISDDCAREVVYKRTFSETVSLYDLIKQVRGFSRTFSDTLTISDSLSSVIYEVILKSLSDTLTISDLFRKRVTFRRNLSETIALSDSIVRVWQYHKRLSDTVSLKDFIALMKNISYIISLFDTVSASDAISLLLNQHLRLFDTLALADSQLFLTSNDIEIVYSGGFIYLHRPYFSGATGEINFNVSNFSFRSGNYDSYVDEINDERITLVGFDNSADVQVRFNTLSIIADEGYEITINTLKNVWNKTYVIESFTYRPIGLDVFEYRLTLRLVR